MMTAPAHIMFLQMGRRRKQVESLKAASELYCQIRDASGAGASTFPEGIIVDDAGNFMARISYNGRVWAQRNWTDSEVPIFDNRMETA